MRLLNPFFWLFLLFFLPNLRAQQHVNMSLLSNWHDPTMPASPQGYRYSDSWGYAANGREYAIIGSARFIHVFDVTEPTNPVEVLRHDGGTSTTWREFRTFGHYLYCITDATEEGLRIFDLSPLPAAPVEVYHSSTFFARCHMLEVDEANQRLYCCGANTQISGIIVLDLSTTPQAPTLLASVSLPAGYVHDCYVRNHIVYASHGFTGLYIYNFAMPQTPVTLGSLTSYIDQGYNHSSWLNDAGTHLVMTDETKTKRVKLVDVTDPTDLMVTDTFKSNLLLNSDSSIAHNPYIRDNLAYLSYYHDGVNVWDISNPRDVQRIGYYDTEPANAFYSGYLGPWGIYPYLPSGNIIVSDLMRGLFLLKLDSKCGPPVHFTIGTVQNKSAALDWNDVPGASQYRVRYKAAQQSSWTVLTTPGSQVTLSGLTPGSNYQVQVAANCPYGWSDYAKLYNFTTVGTPVCVAPDGLSVTGLSPTMATVGWNAVPGATSYRFDYIRTGDVYWTIKNVTQPTITLPNLQPGAVYKYRITTRCNFLQYSPPTAIKTFQTPSSVLETGAGDSDESYAEGSIYPNPVTDWLHVNWPLATEAPIDIVIADLTGKTLLTASFTTADGDHFIFDMEKFPAGVYICSVKSGDSSIVEKICKN